MRIFVKRLAVFVLVAILFQLLVQHASAARNIGSPDDCPCGQHYTDVYWDDSGVKVIEVVCDCDPVINA